MELIYKDFPFPVLFWDAGVCHPGNTPAQNWLAQGIPDYFTTGPARLRLSPGFGSTPDSYQFLWTPFDGNCAFATPYNLDNKPGEIQHPIAVFDADQILVSFNVAWLELAQHYFGYTPSVGEKIPSDQGPFGGELESLLSDPPKEIHSLRTWNTQTYLHHIWPKNNGQGEFIGLIWMALPINRAERTPLWFHITKQLSQNLPDPVAMFDLQRKISRDNKSFQNLVNHYSLAAIFPPGGDLETAIDQALLGKESAFEVTFAKDGEPTAWYSLHLRSIFDDLGRTMGAVAYFHEITEMKNVQEAISQAKLEAEALHEAKTNFISCVSHEIRTPLTAVLNLAEVLSVNAQGLEQIELVLLLKEAAELMMRQINAVLDYSRLERGKIELHPGPVLLHAVIERIARLFKNQAVNRNLDFDVEYDNTLPDLLVFDENALEQILTNLVGNALKFTQEGSIVMKATSVARSETHCTVDIAITDTGAGVDPLFGQQIFALFFQGDSSWKRQHEGIGLGLAIASKLSELMHGCLWYEDNKPHGAIFHCKFEAGTVK